MFDANSTVCTSVHSASLDMYAPHEVEMFSVCKISETQVFHSIDESTFSSPVTNAATAAAAVGAVSASPGALPTPVAGGLYDRRLGSVDGREICATCGSRGDCPGHPGHVQLAIPVFQPALLPSLIKILKFTCFYCGRLRISEAASSLIIKAFELVQLCRLEELQQVSHVALSSFRGGAVPKASGGSLEGDVGRFSERQKIALFRLLRVFDEAAKVAAGSTQEAADCTSIGTEWQSSDPHHQTATDEKHYERHSNEHAASHGADAGWGEGSVSSTRKRRWETAEVAADTAESGPEPEPRYIEPSSFFEKLKVRDAEDKRLTQHFNEDISKSAWQVSSWRHLRRLVWDRVLATSVCPSCGKVNSASFHLAPRSVGVEMRWKWTGKPPFDRRSFFFTSLQTCDPTPQAPGDASGGGTMCADDDAKTLFNERCLTYGRSGQAIGKMQLHAFQLRPLMVKLFSHRLDRLLLQCLIPVSARLTASCFFISTLPVSASNFRPPAAGNAFQGGGSRAMPVLHPRTANLLDLLKINERVLLAVNVMKHPDPVGALEDPSRLTELFSGQPVGSSSSGTGAKQHLSAVLTLQEQRRVKEFVMLHAAGNATWLPAYSTQLQRKFNEIVDSTKAENPAAAAPGIRQWLEKKEGAIRQKMMGKRVNFAARTVLAPDALIATNEIGVPLEFAMKLSIPEPVTPRNAHLLAAMVINGPFRHPGAVSVKDAAGHTFILEYLSAAARQAKARQILAAIKSGSAKGFSSGSRSGGGGGVGAETTFTVYRHVLDGDVVLMNRQPSLHRLSLMGHFVRISRGTCTWYCVNDYLLRNGLQHRLVLKNNRCGDTARDLADSRAVKKEKKSKEVAEGESRRQTPGSRGSLIHYWKRFNNTRGPAPECVPVQKTETTRREIESTEGFNKEDVFRLNFVNCSSYNADFDGDEMNLHLPQDIMARTEAAYILNADCHFLVPKDGGPMRGLIQDFCLAGCMLTARDTFFTADVFQTLVYSGLSCYVDAGEGTVILDRGYGSDSSRLTRGETAVVAVGDPYRRRLLAGTLTGKKNADTDRRLVMVPPAVVWPKRLWTGKQVITCVLKTLVDGIATERLAQVNVANKRSGRSSRDRGSEKTSAMATYHGVNLTSKAKTPGDAWGGADDGDTEEECVIIQESELLQGVFDKAQFGSSAGGLLHCVFILLGSAAAGLLLQSLAALFCAFLKLRGATASPGDFVLRRSGESERQRLAERIVQAGTYLQEHFTARLSDLMGWTEEEESRVSSLGDSEQSRSSIGAGAICQPASGSMAAAGQHRHSGKGGASKCEVLLQMVSDAANRSVEEMRKEMPKASSLLKGVPAAEIQLERLRLVRLADTVYTLLNIHGEQGNGKKTAAVAVKGKFAQDHKSAGHTQLLCPKYADDIEQFGSKTKQTYATTGCLSPWILTRLQRLPLVAAGKLLTAARMSAQLQNFVLMLKTLYEREDKAGFAWLVRLQEASPSLMQQLQNFVQALHGPSVPAQVYSPTSQTAVSTRKHDASRESSDGQLVPVPSLLVCLPNGGFIQGDPSLLQTRLYHPSWLWRAGGRRAVDVAAAQLFEKSERYILQAAARASMASGRRGLRTFCVPSELTQRRIGTLYRKHFLGRKEMFNEMLDAFFQSSIGKVASTSTDIISGSSFLYRFPQNGFAGMIKSGSKGSNINFAMISVFLGQQSLEGRRVKNMPSDRSLPSFCAYDFGSQARGFITSSFLSGLKEEEYFFHCMAGREGLVDTAVKTAKSGYLQRSVIKGMEALTVRYDGSVRDADDTIIQFIYGDDGRDPVHCSTFEKIPSLLENVELLRCMSPASPDTLATVKNNASDGREDPADEELQVAEGPVSPFSQVGVTCPKFEGALAELARNALKQQRRVWRSVNAAPRREVKGSGMKLKYDKGKECPSTSFESSRTHVLNHEFAEETTQVELEALLKVLYHKCLVPPGEAVGCIAAQSIGEPATQMTLNTFHLAGHGAANVTMGIPRLRELLQQGGATKTPVIYVPLRSKMKPVEGDDRSVISELSESAILAQNAATALRAFTTISLAMCVHSVGVETKVCYQGPYCLEGCPAFHLPPYTNSTASPWTAPFSRLYWEYDVCIQMENLSHFVQVVPSYTQAELCVAVLKKVVRIFLKKVSRLMVASVAHHGRAGFAAARNDVQTFYQQRICQEHRLNRWHHRAKVKEILRTAKIATGTAQDGEVVADDALVGGSPSRAGTERKGDAEREQEGQDRGHGDGEADEGEKDNSAGEEEEEEQEKSEEEEEEENEEGVEDGEEHDPKDDGADGVADLWTQPGEKKAIDRRRDATKPRNSGTSPDDAVSTAEDAEIESPYTDSAPESPRDGESSGDSSSEDEHEVEDVTVKETTTPQPTASFRRSKHRTIASCSDNTAETSFLRLSFAELLRGKAFNLRTHLFEAQCITDGTDITPTSTAPSMKADALWESGRRHRGAVLISEEVASILHRISVCPRTWRIVVKFGWPLEKCPYRLEVLPMLKNLLQKSYVQRPEGVTAPRIVQGEGCVLGQGSELQCEGSNIQWIHQMKNESIDHNAICTNDVRAMLKHYGVEAARICLVKELEKVFSAYGIKVDYRHLALIADFMTHEGGIRPFNRSGITASNAPFLQMSYETSFKFLTEACERAAIDSLTTPSGGLMVGTPATVGSQQCEIYTHLGTAAGWGF